MKTLRVELGERSYPIYIGSGLLENRQLLQSIIPSRQVAIITNDVVGPLYQERLIRGLDSERIDVFTLPDGEKNKTLDAWAQIHDFLATRRHNRSTTVVALGGGVVGDMAGFAAAIIGSSSMIFAVFFAVPVGYAFNGTPFPLIGGVALFSGLGFLLMHLSRRYKKDLV